MIVFILKGSLTPTDQLRHEISFYTCHKLVDKVKLFEGLTATLVGTILGCLKPEIYLRNDLLVRAGDIGECMYFIANGTVQVLSSKGAEVWKIHSYVLVPYGLFHCLLARW